MAYHAVAEVCNSPYVADNGLLLVSTAYWARQQLLLPTRIHHAHTPDTSNDGEHAFPVCPMAVVHRSFIG
ncbi:MAG: hypothetical protein AAFR67_15680, partial [Chloroflexota bacterium]